ncbi:MAG: phosphatase PAP2 family protein [Acidobacteriota bacterium]
MEVLKGSPPEPPRRQPGFFYLVVNRLQAVGISLLAGLLFSVAIVVVFGLLAREVFLTARAGPLDREITLFVRGLESPFRNNLAILLTFFGSHLFLIPATLAVAFLLRAKGHPTSALLFFSSVAGGFVLNALLKISFQRARPDLWPALVSEHTYSFPSGHAAMSTVFYGGLAAVVFHLTDRRLPRILAVTLALIAILTIMGTRVYLGVHWTTDVVAGFVVGIFWVVVSAIATEIVYRRVPKARPVRRLRRGAPKVGFS